MEGGERNHRKNPNQTSPPQEPHPNTTTARTPTQPPQELDPTATTATTTRPQPNFQPLPKIKRKTDREGEKEKNQG